MYTKLQPWLSKLGYEGESLDLLLNPPAENDFHLLHNSDVACDFLLSCLTDGKKHKIAIVGDYDCDGVTSTSILTLSLRSIGLDVWYYIPHRIQDGYGLSAGIVDKIMVSHPDTDIIMTCDNGIAAGNSIAYAKSKGFFVIVTDHHSINPDVYPDKADIVVHPTQGKNPFPNISGAQVTWKISQMLFEKFGSHNKALEEYLFQLMAVSIVSDVMPVASSDISIMKHNENRLLLEKGMESLRTNPDWHWKHIFENMKVNPETIDETTIGFYIAPVINATGRLETAKIAVDALTADSDSKSNIYSSMMTYYNTTRKDMKFELLEKTRKLVDISKPVIILQYPMHEGLIGIIAGNYAEQYNRPCFVFAPMELNGEKAWKGSARSPEGCGWNCFENLVKTQELSNSLQGFGGHAGAAGLTVLDKDFQKFEETLWGTASHIDMSNAYEDRFDIELNIDDFKGLDKELESLKPFGNGLPKPLIKTVGKVWRIDMFYSSGHIKLSVKDGEDIWLFGKLQWFKEQYHTDLVRHYNMVSTNESEKGAGQQWERYLLNAGDSLLWQIIAEYDYGVSIDGAEGLIPGNARVKPLS